MTDPERRGGPKPLSEILGALVAARGYGKLRAARELEEAWTAAVGREIARQTKLGDVRRGVLQVTVAHSTLLEELAAYRKPAILAALRQNAPNSPIQDVRFRVGSVAAAGPDSSPATATETAKPKNRGREG